VLGLGLRARRHGEHPIPVAVERDVGTRVHRLQVAQRRETSAEVLARDRQVVSALAADEHSVCRARSDASIVRWKCVSMNRG
jgi:hypothetical protein